MKAIFILFFLIISTHLSFSQTEGLRLGVYAGIGQSNIRKGNISNSTGKLALQGGLAMNYQFSKNLGLYSNLLLTGKGAEGNGTETVSGLPGSGEYKYKQEFSLYYIEIPIMPKVSIGTEKFYIKAFAGPSINFNVGAKQDKMYETPTIDNQLGYSGRNMPEVELIEYSLVCGAGFDVETANKNIFFMEARYNSALNSLGPVNSTKAFNQYFTVGLGYLYKY